MIRSKVIIPTAARGFVSRHTNLGIDSYDLDELYSPDTNQWRSKVLDVGSPKYPPQTATAPTRYWFDRSRFNNHGTISGAVWSQLPSGVWVMKLDGVDDLIDCGRAAPLLLTSALTIVAWVKIAAYGATHYQIIGQQGTGAGYAGVYVLVIRATTGVLKWYHGNGVDSEISKESTVPIPLNVHNHIVARRIDNGGGNYTIAFFINGVLDNSQGTGLLAVADNGTTNIRIGLDQNNGSDMAGTIDEIRIYNIDLSDSFPMQDYIKTKWRYGI